jgi:hypothetical protein
MLLGLRPAGGWETAITITSKITITRSITFFVIIIVIVLGGSPGKMKSGDYPPSPRLRRASEHE